jgi:hypothetical protein
VAGYCRLEQSFFLVDPLPRLITLPPMSKNARNTVRRLSLQASHHSYFIALLLLLALFGATSSRAADPDEQYLKIFNVIEKADALNASGQTAQALAKYRDAQTALENFQKTQPAWNGQIVSFRMEYVGQKIAELAPKAPKPAKDESNQGGQDSSSESTASPASSAVEIKLLEPGSEPRKVLRLHPNPGDKQSLKLTLVMAMEIKAGEMQNPMKMPPMTMTMDATVKDVSPQGDITYEILMGEANVAEDADAMPQVVTAMKAALGGVKGVKGTGVISAQGMPKSSEMDVPANADPQMRQTMEQAKDSFKNLAAPFPVEAVGAGARWEVKQPIKSQGMTINQTTTYQITSIEGERVAATSNLSQTAANQKIQNPAMQGVKLDLTKMVGTGKGNINFDLAHLMPIASALDSHTDMSMAMNMGNQKQTMSMKMDMNLKLEAK